MTTNSKELQTISPESEITKKDFWKCFRRSCTLDSSWNYERMQNLAFAYMMAPIIRRLYKDEDKRADALKRHMEFMSVTPHISTLLVGVAGAMEEENAKNKGFDAASINAVKSSLMGPILFFLIINIPHFVLRYICLDKGFKYGAQFFKDLSMSNVVSKVTEAASMLGLMVIGGMTAANVYFELPIMIGSGEWAEPLQSYLDEIMPCLLPALLFLLMYWLIGKKVKTTTLLLSIIVVCIVLAFVGIV